MITHLNDLPEALLREARALSDPAGIKAMLMRHTSPEAWEHLEAFIDDVVLGGEPAARWRRGQVVVPDFSLADQLRLDRVDLLAPLQGSFLHRVRPSLEDWRSGASWVGAPALVLPDADYRYDVPDGAIGLGGAETERVADGAVALRRWIAARVARSIPEGQEFASLEAMAGAIPEAPPVHAWSLDARIAGTGLLRERGEPNAVSAGVPGMIGPDQWYRE